MKKLKLLTICAILVPKLVLAQEDNMSGTSSTDPYSGRTTGVYNNGVTWESNTNPYSGQTNYYDSTGKVCESSRNPYSGQVNTFCR